MNYAHDPSTPAYYAELLARTLMSGNWEPSPTVIGDVAMTDRRTIGDTIASQTVTLYPSELVDGLAKGSVSSTITYVCAEAKVHTDTRTAWFAFALDSDVVALRLVIASSFQTLN